MKPPPSTLALALVLAPSCLAVERWPRIEPPYSKASIEAGRELYVRPRNHPPVTIEKPVWVEEEGRAWISGAVREEPDGIFDVPRRWYMETVWEQEKPWREPGRVAVDEIQTLRMEPVSEPGANLTPYAVMLCLGLIVLVIALA